MKYRLLKKEAIGYVLQTESKIFDGLLLTYGVLSLELQFGVLLYSFVNKKNWSSYATRLNLCGL